MKKEKIAPINTPLGTKQRDKIRDKLAKEAEKEMGFDLDKVYQKELSKKELLRIIKRTYDKKFIVLFIPRTKSNADILIRSFKEEIKEFHKED